MLDDQYFIDDLKGRADLVPIIEAADRPLLTPNLNGQKI